MVISAGKKQNIGARLAEIAGGGSHDCLLMQSDSYCSQSGPFYQSEHYLTLMALGLAFRCCQQPANFLCRVSLQKDGYVHTAL